jgi:hypothetical protein
VEGDVGSKNSEDAEQFLRSVLGEESELGLDVVIDVLGSEIYCLN